MKNQKRKETSTQPSEPDTPVKAIKYGRPKFRWTDWRSYKRYIVDRFLNPNYIIINMELHNGSHEYFLLELKGTSFVRGGCRYVIDESLKYLIKPTNLYALDYHQGISLPIKRHTPINDVMNTMKSLSNEVEFMANPSVLERFVTSNITEQVLHGGVLSESLRQLFILIIVNAAISAGVLLFLLYKSGILAKLGVGG